MSVEQGKTGEQPTEQDEFAAAFSEAAAQLHADEPASNEPAEGAEGEQPAAGEAAAAPASAAPAASAPAAAAPAAAPALAAEPTLDELKEQLRQSQHRERSASERIPAYQRKYDELLREVVELKKRVAAPAAPAPAAAAPAPAAAEEDDVLTGAPDLDKAVARRMAKATKPLEEALAAANAKLVELGATTQHVQETVAPIAQRESRAAIEDTWKALDGRFTEQWKQDVKSQKFHEWLGAQPRRTQDLYAQAIDPADCSDVLTLFYAANGGVPKPSAAPAPASAAAAPAAGGKAPTSQDRLRAAVGVPPSRGTAVSTQPPMDEFDAAFAAASKSIQAERARTSATR